MGTLMITVALRRRIRVPVITAQIYEFSSKVLLNMHLFFFITCVKLGLFL